MQEGDDLPPEIEQRLDPASGYAYYYNTETQQSAWTLSEVATAAVVDEVPRGGDPAAVQGDNGIELGSWADLTSPVTPPRGASEVPSHIDEMLDSNGVPYYVDRTTGQSAWSPEELTSGGGAADAAEMEAAEMAVTDLADLSVAYDSTGENGTGARPRSQIWKCCTCRRPTRDRNDKAAAKTNRPRCSGWFGRRNMGNAAQYDGDDSDEEKKEADDDEDDESLKKDRWAWIRCLCENRRRVTACMKIERDALVEIFNSWLFLLLLASAFMDIWLVKIVVAIPQQLHAPYPALYVAPAVICTTTAMLSARVGYLGIQNICVRFPGAYIKNCRRFLTAVVLALLGLSLADWFLYDYPGFAKKHCADILHLVHESWFADHLGCSKYSGPSQHWDEKLASFVWTHDEPGLLESLSECSGTESDTDLGVFAWERNAPLNAGPTCRSCETFYGCLNVACCDDLEETTRMVLYSRQALALVLLVTLLLACCLARRLELGNFFGDDARRDSRYQSEVAMSTWSQGARRLAQRMTDATGRKSHAGDAVSDDVDSALEFLKLSGSSTYVSNTRNFLTSRLIFMLSVAMSHALELLVFFHFLSPQCGGAWCVPEAEDFTRGVSLVAEQFRLLLVSPGRLMVCL
jgi:hypothetical protein